MTIVFAILMFGFLITTHELGHYLFARLFHVSIEEFSVGMGPKLFSHKSKKTGIAYSLRLLPLGGYVSMVGEDGEAEDPNALCHKKPWQRLIIMAAGGLTNLLTGLILCLVYVLMIKSTLLSTQIGGFIEPEDWDHEERYAVSSYVLKPGDEVLEVNGNKVSIYSEFAFEVMWGVEKADTLTVQDENGNPVVLKDVALLDVKVRREGEVKNLAVPFRVTSAEGLTVGMPDVRVYAEKANFGSVMKHTFHESGGFVRQIWASLGGLFTGRVGLSDLSGPVGITQQMNEAASYGFEYVIYLAALIAINLGVVNLLPIPALDGGRIVFLLIEWIRGKPVNREIEGRIHTTALLLLFALMIFILIKDIIGLF